MSTPLMLICPQCNAVNAVAPEVARAICVRCGESFATATAEHSLERPDESALPTVAPAPGDPRGFLYTPAAWGVSFGFAAVILIVGLAVVRPWEPRGGTGPISAKLPVINTPLGLAGLAYMPARANILAAIQPMPLLMYAAQQKLDPKAVLRDAGLPEAAVQVIDKLGLPLDQIDHVVIGVHVANEPGQILPGVTACLKLTRPLTDETAFLAALKADKNAQQSQGNRMVYSVNLGLPLLLTRVDSTTYLFGLDGNDLTPVDTPAPPGGGHLSKDLREMMTARLNPTAFVWLATDIDTWHEKPVVKLLAALPQWKTRYDQITQGRAVLLSLAIDTEAAKPAPIAKLSLRLKDEPTAARVRGQLQELAPSVSGDETWAVLEGPPAPLARSLYGGN